MQMAAALSYYTMFSLPPLLVIVVSIAGLFFDASDVHARLGAEIKGVIGEKGVDLVRTMIEHANQPSRGLIGTVVGIGVLLFGATGVMAQLQEALNEAWDVKPNPNASSVKYFLLKRLVSLAMVMGVSFLLLVSLVFSAIVSALREQITAWIPDQASRILFLGGNALFSLVLVGCLFALMFKYLPDAQIRWRDVWLGALITSVLFGLGKWALGVYLGRSDIADTYGAAGSLALILVWVYYSGVIFLFGAEFTHAWARRDGHRILPEPGAIAEE